MSSELKTASPAPSNRPEPIAIIGMGALFPDAPGLQHYQGLIRTGVDAISTVPLSHWDRDELVRPKGEHLSGKFDYTYSDKGGFLGDLPFDPMEYGIPPTVLEATDTAQLLGLVTGRMALDHAGYGADREFDRSRTSVILGVTGALELVVPLGARLGHPQWRRAMIEVGIDPDLAQAAAERITDYYVPWQENSFPGLLGNVVAGRIANRLNLRGTNCVVDAACASSLAALHLAVLELRAGHSDMVLCGGVDAFNDIFMFMCFTKTQALSPSGHARPFSPNADGTVLGEGVGMVVLKRLSDAQRDGDHIRAVILSVGTSSDGRSQSIYAPRSEGQAAALRNAYRQAGVSPRQVELVEAHGTGTKVGDQVEFDALRTVYAESAPDDVQWCTLGSVKSQIGHTKSAAGAASLIKAALALEHKMLPGTLKHDGGNPALALDRSPFRLGDRTRPWVTDEGKPRRAAVSSFGFGGSNFHAVLEEASAAKCEAAWDGTVQIAAASGRDRRELVNRLEALAADLKKDARPEWRAWQLQESRRSFRVQDPHRILLILSRASDDQSRLLRAIDALKRDHPRLGAEIVPGVWYGSGEPAGQLAFLYPGQGSQYPDMAIDWTCVFPELEKWVARFHREIPGLWNLMHGQGGPERDAELARTDRAQASLGAVSAGLTDLLCNRFGLRPDAVAGHSYGELPALLAAGRLSDEEFVRATVVRGRVMAEAGNVTGGAMAAVLASREQVEAALAEGGAAVADVVAANNNAPEQLVISGPATGIDRAIEILTGKGMTVRRLAVSGAFHSPAMEPAAVAFRNELTHLQSRQPNTNGPLVYRCLNGQVAPADLSAVDHLAQQITGTVDWVKTVEALYRDGVRTFVEVGSRSVLSGLVRRILGNQPFDIVTLDPSGGKNDGIVDLASALCQLAALGYGVNLTAFEMPVVEPRKQAMTVNIRGINYRSTPIPKVDRRAVRAITQKTESAATPAHSEAPQARPDSPKPPAATPPPTPTLQTPVRTSPSMTTHLSAGSAPANRQALEGALLAIQNMHERTAQVHAQFLQAMQQSQASLIGLLTGQLIAPASPQAAPPMPTAPPAAVAPLAPVAAPVAPPAPEVPPLPSVSVTQPQTAPAPVTTAVKPSETVSLESDLLAVVAELTGYPADMIDLSMDLESDLGIDSIKRVEILAAIQRRVPGLPQVDSTRLGSLRTLQEVQAELLAGLRNRSVSANETPISATNAPAISTSGQLGKVLVDVVAELTGYPSEMIDLSMDLESDLGIDSIKRVEILAAVQRRMPSLPTVDSTRMGSLRTLEEILAELGAGASAEAPTVPATTGPTSDVELPSRLQSVMISCVAELTGYPADMIEMGMDLESDLGIDSIKRVEILAAVQREMPELPAIDSAVLGSLRTLAEIVAAFGSKAPTEHARNETRVPNSVSADGMMDALLRVVSELTGYPVDMIDPTMDLEADLGIDSIKRVEILAAAQRIYPDLCKVDSSQLNSRSTLQAIVDLASKVIAEPSVEPGQRVAAAQASTGSAPASQAPRTVERRIPVLRSVSVSAVAHFPLPSGAKITIVSESGSLADALAHMLRSEGYGVNLVAPGTSDLDRSTTGLIVLGTHLTRNDSHSGWTVEDEDWIIRAFASIQAASRLLNRPGTPTLLASVTALNGAFGLGNQHRPLWNPVAGALAGLVKTASQEWSSCHCVALDVAPVLLGDSALLASRILPAASAAISHGLMELGITPSEFVTVDVEQRPAVRGNSSPHLQPGDTVLVLGGARGVTVDCLEALVREIPLNLVLTGRTALREEPHSLRSANTTAELRAAVMALPRQGKGTPAAIEREVRQYQAMREVRDTMARLARAGCSGVHYETVDVSSEAAVVDLVRRVTEKHGAIRGLVHAAGIIEDRLIEDKTADQFARVWNTKVPALRAVLDTLDMASLRAVALFSSVSARFGNQGQVDYAMANEVLNKCADALSHQIPGCRVVSCNWGPWDGGMVGPELKRVFEARGVTLIDLQAGARAFAEELLATSETAAVEVVLGNGLNRPFGPRRDKPELVRATEARNSTPSHGAASPLPVALTRAVDVHSHPFLNSHVLAGRAVLPLAIMAEWMANAAVASLPGMHLLELRGLRVLRGLKLNGETVTLRVGSAPGEFANGMQQVDLDLSSDLGIHGRTRAWLSTNRAEDRTLPPGVFHPLGELAPFGLTMDEAYRKYLFHGPDFQGIVAIDGGIGPRGLKARVRTAPLPADWMASPVRKRWILDPMLVDTALQAGILFTQHHAGLPCLPASIESIIVCNAMPEPNRTCVLELSVTRQEPHRLVADAVILDGPAGRAILALTGIEWTVDAGLKAAFAQNGQATAGQSH